VGKGHAQRRLVYLASDERLGLTAGVAPAWYRGCEPGLAARCWGHYSMRWIVLSLVAILAILGLAPCATSADARELHIQDQIFLLYATEMDLTQVRLGQLAADKAQDEQIRQFARRMINYHQQSNARLVQMAQQYGIQTPQGLSPVAQRMQDELQGLTGPGFEYEYITSQVIYDYSAHYFYRREERHGFDRQLQQEADQQAEHLREHRREAQQIARRLEAQPAGLHPEDSTFLLYAMDVDLTQLQLSQLAADKAQDEQVRQFARRMLDYHGRSYDRLTRIAEENGIKQLQEIGLIAQTMADGLRQLSAPLFDWQYINAQVIYHYSAFYRYERESIHGRDRYLRALAAHAFRDVKEHHDMALGIVRDWNWDKS
jgi:putative membrane protein